MNNNDYAKIKWRCRRGMLELDTMLNHFFDHQFQHLTPKEKETFSALLDHPDQELYRWLIGMEEPKNKQETLIISKIIKTNML